jgi:uncharacterized protein YndB with AHSA1/START domain
MEGAVSRGGLVGSKQWKVRFKSAPSEVYRALSTPLGRSRFWADSAKEADGVIHFVLPGDRVDDSRIERALRDQLYAVTYFGRLLTFTLAPDDETNGTDLTLTYQSPDDPAAAETDSATWVSLLLRLKASVDFGVDLRNHDDSRTTNYADGT